MSRQNRTLGRLARAGFDDLARAASLLESLAAAIEIDEERLLAAFSSAGDPDEALTATTRLQERAPHEVAAVLGQDASAERMARLFGASRGFADFMMRHPAELAVLRQVPMPPLHADDARAVMLAALDNLDDDDADFFDAAAAAVRVRYRRLLAAIAVYDLTRPNTIEAVDTIAAGLADLAGAALDAAIVVARRAVARAEGEPAGPGRYP
ncbi:MAG TPA: bifunctional glutamine-synthetase adenylyltransferase/deadenyltransferase, partial [Agromyces sp.]